MPVNLPNLFTKSSSKKKQPEDNSPPSSPEKRSPEKRPSLKPARSPTKDRDRTTRAASNSKTSSRNSKKLDPDTHPLNLPPEQLRRLSALSGMSEQRNSGDADRESTSSPKPQSPSPNGLPGAFPKQNGTHNDDDEVRPVPPPHRTPTSPPPQQQAPPPPNPVDAEALKAAGNKLHKQGNYAQAIKEYTKAIEADPKNPIYRNNRAASYMGIEQYAEALEDTRFADELEPMNPKYLHRMAKIFPKLGRPGEAVEIYQRIGPPAIAKEKEAAEWMHNQLTTAENQIKSGKEFLDAAAELQSATNDLLRTAPGTKGGWEDSVAWAKKMEELITNANTLIQRRTAAQLQRLAAGGDNKKLVEKAEELTKSTKDNVIKEGRERMHGAIVALKWAEQGLGSSIKPPRRWKLLEAEAYLEKGDGGQAKKLLTPLLRENMAEPEALVLMGRIHYSEGDNEEAIKHFRKALSGDPEHKEAVKYFRLVQKVNRLKEEGNTFFKTGSYKSAIEKYTEAIELDSKTSGTRSKLLQNRGLCHTKLKNWQPAIDDCTEALDLDASYTKAKKTRAKALGEKGDWEAALKDWQAIQEKDGQTQETASEIRKIELEIKKSKRKDYYKILGVDKEAGDSEIKRAYRKLAVVHHPDKNPGDPDADNRFKDIGEAYETLSDPQKRQRYDSGEDLLDPSDMFGGGGMGGMGGMGGGVQIDPSMLFNMFGGGGGMGGMGGGQGGGFHFAQGGSPFGGGGMPGGGRSRGGQHFHFG